MFYTLVSKDPYSRDKDGTYPEDLIASGWVKENNNAYHHNSTYKLDIYSIYGYSVTLPISNVGDFDIVATFLFKAGPSKHGDLLGDD
jgi:hypothetical protein